MTKTFSTLTLLFVLLFQSSVFAGETGIAFFEGTFEEAKAKAKKENKMVFVDAYAAWCGPCRWMSANVFTDPAVGEYFNEHFVCMKMDMEKGEGRTYAREWGIRAYPTLLFFDAAGKELKRDMGAKKAEPFIAIAKGVVG